MRMIHVDLRFVVLVQVGGGLSGAEPGGVGGGQQRGQGQGGQAQGGQAGKKAQFHKKILLGVSYHTIGDGKKGYGGGFNPVTRNYDCPFAKNHI